MVRQETITTGMVLQSKTDMADILLLLHVTAMPTEDIPLAIRIRTADIPRHHRGLLRETALPTQPHLVPTTTDVAHHTLPTLQPMDLVGKRGRKVKLAVKQLRAPVNTTIRPSHQKQEQATPGADIIKFENNFLTHIPKLSLSGINVFKRNESAKKHI